MDTTEILYKKIANILTQNNFSCELDKNFINENLKTGLFAQRSGKSMRIFPYGDYIFVHFNKFKSVLPDEMMQMHQKARKYVNSLYKLPKAMRWTVPNIASLFISTNGFSETMKANAQKRTRTMIGGEIHTINLIDLQNLDFVSQGINYTYVSAGLKMEFKNVDPQNRMFYLINSVAEWVFKNKAEFVG